VRRQVETEEFERNVEAATSTFLIQPYSSLVGPFTNPVLNSNSEADENKNQRAAALGAQLHLVSTEGAKHYIPL